MFSAFIFNIVVYIMDVMTFQKWQTNDNFKLRIFQLLKGKFECQVFLWFLLQYIYVKSYIYIHCSKEPFTQKYNLFGIPMALLSYKNMHIFK